MTMLPAPLHPVRDIARADEWNAVIAAAPEGHLLQSYEWGELKARHGWRAERLLATAPGGMAAAQVLWRPTPLGAVGYIPRGPVVDPKGHDVALRLLLDELHRRGRARHAVMLKVEPNSAEGDWLTDFGFRPSHQTVQPKATLVLDLTRDADTLLRRQHHKTRYNIRLAARQGVKVRRGGPDEVVVFARLMAETGSRDGFAVRPTAYFRDLLELLDDHADLLLAEHEGDVLAGVLIARFGREAVYLYGASGSVKRNLMPNHALQWEAIQRARAVGCTVYDFWAVPAALLASASPGAEGSALPEAADHQQGGLWGVYRFKRGFGGRLVGYAGAYDFPYSLARYWLWERLLPYGLRLARRTRGLGSPASP